MTPHIKTIRAALWMVVGVSLCGIVATALWARNRAARQTAAMSVDRDDDERLPKLFNAPQFSLTDQAGRTVSSESLRGRVWVAILFFTECPGICPMMTGRLADVQKSITDPNVEMISFSVDPEHDTPEKMKLFAEKMKVNESRWRFLTGSKETMFGVIRGLKLAAEPAHDGQPIMHAQQVLLVDTAGQVRGVYDSNDDDALKRLASDANLLAGAKGAS